MKSDIRAAVLLLLFFPVVWILASYLSLAWFFAFVDNRTFTVLLGWVYPGQLIEWGFYLLFFFAIGVVVAALVKNHRPVIYAAALALVYSLVRLYVQRNHFTDSAGPLTYFWVYGQHFMPILGAAAGAATAMFVQARRYAGSGT